MKKTFTININGIIFHIEEDAYEELQKYLIALKNYFGGEDEGREIIFDIESRIAEIFSEKSDNSKVVTLDMVQQVIETMGKPENFMEEEDEGSIFANGTKRKRRLYRDHEHRVIGGVCGGLAAYFNMDPVMMRIIFVILFFITSGTALLAYLILWLAVPKALTIAQRLEMHGQEATVKNIQKSIKEEFNEVKENYQKFRQSDTYNKGKKSMEAVGEITYNVFSILLRIIAIVFGVFLVLFGFFGILALISSLVAGSSFGVGWPLFSDSDLNVPLLLQYFITPGFATLGVLLISILLGLPLLAILFVGTKLIFRYKTNNAAIGLSMVGIWLFALAALIISSVGQLGDFRERASLNNSELLACDSCQTLVLTLADDRYEDYVKTDFEFKGFQYTVMMSEKLLLGRPKLDIEKADTEDFSITVKKTAYGKSHRLASELIKKVTYNYSLTDSVFRLDPFFVVSEIDKFHGQEVDITLKIPEGKSFAFDNSVLKIIDDIEILGAERKGNMVGKSWLVTSQGLVLKDSTLVLNN